MEKGIVPQVINMWTNPRSLSTALAYSFAERSDTQVLDEPLCAHYWQSIGGNTKPDLEAFSNRQFAIEETDGDKVIAMIIGSSCNKKYRFCKHMAVHYSSSFKTDILLHGKHFILIRDPIQNLSSLSKIVPLKILRGDWIAIAVIYYKLLRLGMCPPIIDARDLQDNPEGTLRALCNALTIDFQPEMLRWNAGPRKFHVITFPQNECFYESVHGTTEFLQGIAYPKQPFPTELYPVLHAAWPIYSMLKKQAIKPDSSKNLFDANVLHKPALVWVKDGLVPSLFCENLHSEDGVWGDLKIIKRKVLTLTELITRLCESATSLGNTIPDREFIKRAIFSTVIANGIFDKATVRVVLTRDSSDGCSKLSVFPQTNSWDEEDQVENLDECTGEIIPENI